MGADFVALIPSEEAHMGYGYVHKIRAKLVKMVDQEVGERFADTFPSNGYEAYNYVLRELEQMVDATDDDIIRGVLAFTNHSDCDGDFYGDDCEDILKALKKLAETDDDEVVANLIKVFEDAVMHDGQVEIH